MRKVMTMVVGMALVSAVSAFAACGSCGADKPVAAGDTKAVCQVQTVYVCTMCKIGAKEAGKCAKCGMKLAKMHVLACEDGVVKLCSCDTGCTCKIADDGAKCGCGKDVVKIAMKNIPGCGGGCKK